MLGISKLRLTTRACFVAITGVIFIFAALLEIDVTNGPWYWRWSWRDLNVFLTAAYFLPGLFPLIWVLLKIQEGKAFRRPALPLALLAFACFLSQISGILADPRGFRLLHDIVASPVATSYHTDALKIADLRSWLASFHEASLELHSSTHPPGPILYYYLWIKLLGPNVGATVGGVGIALLAASGVVVIYAFATLWTSDTNQRLLAAAFYALLPGLILFLPEFDQIYPILSMGMILAWTRALDGNTTWSWAFGGLLFVASFLAYNLLATGAFLALYTIIVLLIRERAVRKCWVVLAKASCNALLVAIALHVLFWAVTGYRPIASFLHALDAQAYLAGGHGRPWLACAFFDLYDFILASGIIALPLLLIFLQRVLDEHGDWSRAEIITLIGFTTVLIIDVSGLLRAETARVWLFLQPLIVVPVALELGRLPRTERLGLFGLQWLILVVIKSKMHFVNP